MKAAYQIYQVMSCKVPPLVRFDTFLCDIDANAMLQTLTLAFVWATSATMPSLRDGTNRKCFGNCETSHFIPAVLRHGPAQNNF